jgi:hypothetical protein
VDLAFLILYDNGRVVQANVTAVLALAQRLAHLTSSFDIIECDYDQKRHHRPPLENMPADFSGFCPWKLCAP